MSFDNRSVLVTGGARGIGRACAAAFLKAGARVVIADVDEDAGSRAVEELGEHGAIRFVRCDVSRKDEVDNLVAATVAAHGGIDALVNNAGIVHASDFLAVEEADFDRVLGVNLKGAFLVGQAVARVMVEAVASGGEPGAIVNMSSINAEVAIATQVPYAVSKGGVAQLTRVMALALAPHGIRVNAVGPGSIMTDMLASVATDRAAERRLLSRTPLLRIGRPEEIAAIVLFLASPAASYVTGQTLYADGGRLALNYTVAVPE